MESPEKALEAYRAGELDVITNADFSPVLLKLLAPYEDFRKTTFAAVNLYELNLSRAEFQDRRVRQALSMAIDRERLTEGELEGTTRPALSFMPFSDEPRRKLVQDRERAGDLLEEAGYPGGENFPPIRLVVNRNDTQQRIARSVAAMWKEALNVNTEIIVTESADIQKVRDAGDYDVIRRGVVLATPNESANIRAIFGPNRSFDAPQNDGSAAGRTSESTQFLARNSNSAPGRGEPSGSIVQPGLIQSITTEDDALLEIHAIPLYFPSSYSLIKPYVMGFDINSLDYPLLIDVSIDETWQPSSVRSES
jgi:ABC-type transport system substrate-binding protein